MRQRERERAKKNEKGKKEKVALRERVFNVLTDTEIKI